MTHHVGLLLVDEIQNAVETAQRNRQIKPLLKFLVELTNDTATAVYFVGTPVAEQPVALSPKRGGWWRSCQSLEHQGLNRKLLV